MKNDPEFIAKELKQGGEFCDSVLPCFSDLTVSYGEKKADVGVNVRLLTRPTVG